MYLTTAQSVVWLIGFILEVLVCGLALRRRLFRDFPVFTLYVFVVPARDLLIFALYHSSGYGSRTALYFYWLTQALELFLRGAAIGEISSGSPSPTLGKNIALAYVPPAMSAVGTNIYVEIRGQRCKAQVVATPFYKRGRKPTATVA